MPRVSALLLAFLPSFTLHAQIKHTTVPMGDALTRALAGSSLTTPGAEPFHLLLSITEPENPQSPYQATLEEWWSSDRDWRREITSPQAQLKQIIITHDGTRSEQDTGDYFPLWLRNFVLAAFDPVPDAAAWTSSGINLDQITMPNGAHSDPCARAKSTIGTGDQATDAFSSVCFDAQGRLSLYVSPRYGMEFRDYRPFGKKQVPRQLVDDPEPGTKLVGSVTVLEPLSKVPNAAALFTPLPTTDTRFQSVSVGSATIEKLSAGQPAIVWPPVHSGNTRGHLGMYLGVDSTGQVREAWPLNSDNAGLEDPARDQVRKWKLRVATGKDGKPVQVDGPLGLAFNTQIGDALPELNDAETRALATSQPEPQWPAGRFPSGTVIEAVVSVNEAGKVAGVTLSKTPEDAVGAVDLALSKWQFHPLIRDGHPQYFHGTVRFVIP